MHLRNCFVDEDGNIWKDTSLIKASKDIPVEPFDPYSVSLDEDILWKTDNVRDLVYHYERIRDADCSIPLILRSDGYPMDGWHRIIKARSEGLELIAKRFVVDPKPDFVNGEMK